MLRWHVAGMSHGGHGECRHPLVRAGQMAITNTDADGTDSIIKIDRGRLLR